jgi:hypothetical protein
VQTASGFSGVMKTAVSCFDAIADGGTPGSCNPPPTDANLSSALAGERVRIADAAASCESSSSPPAEYGYAECPAPCGSIAVSAWPDVAACISCLGEAAVYAATGTAYGSGGPPPGVSPEAAACQQDIGRALVGLAFTVLTETRKCEEGADAGKVAVPAGLDCRTADLKGRKALGADAAAERIASGCATPLAFQGLQTCGNDVPSVTTCVTAAGFQLADDIARAVWPELRGAGSPSGAFLDGEG